MPPPPPYLTSMDGDTFGRLFYLILLGVAVGSWFFVENRQSLGKSARQAAAWGLIFLGAIAAYGLWSDIQRDVLPAQAAVNAQGQIEVPQAPDGHYYLTLQLNDAPVRFLVDTGASAIVLSQRDAERAGIDPDGLTFTGRAMTANGEVRTARTRIQDVSLAGVEDRNVTVAVTDGALGQSLLGMDYLRRFERVEIADGRLVLSR